MVAQVLLSSWVLLASPQVTPVALPDAPDGGLFLDYLAVDRARGEVWVPAGATGRVDVIDARTHKLREVRGFATAAVQHRGRTFHVGPSSASVGEGVVYVGNRGDSSVCAISETSLKKGPCVTLHASPDGVVYVAPTKEVWVTTPREHAIVVLDASKPDALRETGTIALPGEPEGYAVDAAHGRFFTNLEDQDQTLTLDLHKRAVVARWAAGCGEEGPRGLAFDARDQLLFVACTDRAEVVDPHDGKQLSSVPTGAGLDNLDFLEPRRELFAAAGRAGQLTVIGVEPKGASRVIARIPTAEGARNAVASEDGTAFIGDGPHGRVLVVAPSR